MRRSATLREKARPGRAGHSEDIGQVALARSCWPRRAKPPTTKQGESESALERYISREQRRQRKQVQVCQLAAATRASTTSPSRLSILQQGTASWLQARKPRTPNGRLRYTRRASAEDLHAGGLAEVCARSPRPRRSSAPAKTTSRHLGSRASSSGYMRSLALRAERGAT